MRALIPLVSLLVLGACGSATDAINSDVDVAKLQARTASYFRTPSQNVSISKFRQTVLGTEYQAQVSGRAFNCHYFQSSVSCEGAQQLKGSGFTF